MDMMASCSPVSLPPSLERPSQRSLLSRAEAAFRAALIESIESLELCDRNLLRFHYFRGLGPDQLAAMFGTHRAAVLRQLGRIHDRVLRDTLHSLTLRLTVDKHQLDRVLGVARARFDLALALVLRA